MLNVSEKKNVLGKMLIDFFNIYWLCSVFLLHKLVLLYNSNDYTIFINYIILLIILKHLLK